MAIWRYKGPGNCNCVYSLDVANPLVYRLAVLANIIRGVYAACMVYKTGGILTAAVSHWVTGMHVSFEVKEVRNSLSLCVV